MAFVQTPNLTVFYEQAGQGPPCLIISGTGSDLRLKPNVMDFPLHDLFTVTAYDQRGLGQTISPPPPYHMADYADDAAAVMDSLEIDHAVIFGVSFGGMVAQELALRHPARVSRMALFCTTSGGAGGSSFPLHSLADLSVTERATRLIMLNDTRDDSAWLQNHPKVLDDQRDRMQKAAELSGAPNGAAAQLAARAGHDCWERLPLISCPTFIAGGTHDGIAAPDAVTRLAQKIPNAHLRFYDGGHLFWNTAPQAVRDLRQFLRDNPRFHHRETDA